MLSLVETLMEDLGIEIPDDANEIYAEYHEVEEVTSDTTVLTSEEETDISRVMDDLAAAEELDDAEDIETAMSDLAAQSEEDTGKLAAEEEVDEPEKVEEEEAEELEEAAEEEGEEPEEIEEEEAEEPEEVEEKEASEPEEVEEEEAEKPEEVEEKETDESESEEAEEAEKPEEVEEKETDEPKEAEEKTKKPEEVEGEEPEQKPAKKSVLELDEESQEMVNKLKEKLAGSKKEKQPKHTEKEIKKPTFKTKDTSSVGVVIQDDLDEFLAEKEMEEQVTHHEDSGLKIRKNIKVSRASILKNTQEELKAAEEKEAEQKALEEVAEAEDEVTEVAETEDEEVVSNSILSQTISGATGLLRGNVNVPKVNPYLIRVNTNERIMITKQNFKVGKASMGVDYTVKGNGAVSRVHAVIMNKDGIYYIRDNKSTNHTYVNGKMLEEGENELLTQDCKIVLGDEEFIFKLR